MAFRPAKCECRTYRVIPNGPLTIEQPDALGKLIEHVQVLLHRERRPGLDQRPSEPEEVRDDDATTRGQPVIRRTEHIPVETTAQLTGQEMLPVFDYPNPLGCADVAAPSAMSTMSASARVGSVSGR